MGTLYGMAVAIGVSMPSIGGVKATAIDPLSFAHQIECLEDMAVLEAEIRRSPLASNLKIGDQNRGLPAA